MLCGTIHSTVRTLLILQTGPLASPGVTQSACLWKQPVFLQWTVVSYKGLCSDCRTASVFPFLKFWMLDFYNHNDLLVYTGNYKHKAILAYYSSLIYSIYFMLHQLQQPSYHAATRALARHRPPSLQSPGPRHRLHLHHLLPAPWQQGPSTKYCCRLQRQRSKPQEEQLGERFWGSSQAHSGSLDYWHWWYWWQLVEWD